MEYIGKEVDQEIEYAGYYIFVFTSKRMYLSTFKRNFYKASFEVAKNFETSFIKIYHLKRVHLTFKKSPSYL